MKMFFNKNIINLKKNLGLNIFNNKKNIKNFAVELEASKTHQEELSLEAEKKIIEAEKKLEEENKQKIINQKLKESGKNYKTLVYLWNSSASIKVRKRDLKNKINNTTKPQKISFFDDKNIKSIYCGLSHSAFITDEGYLYMFGNNTFGQLGQGNVDDLTKENPKIVPYLAERNIKIKKVCCSVSNTIALSEDGDVYSWGFGGEHSRKFAVYKSKIK